MRSCVKRLRGEMVVLRRRLCARMRQRRRILTGCSRGGFESRKGEEGKEKETGKGKEEMKVVAEKRCLRCRVWSVRFATNGKEKGE